MKIKKTLFSTSIEITPQEIREMAERCPFNSVLRNFIDALSDFFKTFNK